MKSLLIVGAGEFGHLVSELARNLGYEKIGFLDDKNPDALGKIADFLNFSEEFEEFFISIGNSKIRELLFTKFSKTFQTATLISPLAYVSPSAVVKAGCIVEPMAVINTGAIVGHACIINAGAVVNHNASVGDYCQINCNAVVSADHSVPPGGKVDEGCVWKG